MIGRPRLAFLTPSPPTRCWAPPAPAGTEVSFTVGGKYTLTGLINRKSQVEHVQTWIDNPVLGDMLVEATYRDYETVNGVAFPMHILQQRGGYPAFELWVSSVTPNAAP